MLSLNLTALRSSFASKIIKLKKISFPPKKNNNNPLANILETCHSRAASRSQRPSRLNCSSTTISLMV
jgi:hypothetical protein